MRYGKLFSWGIVMYAIMYLLVAALSLYGFYPGIISRVVALLALVAMATGAGISLRARTVKDILPYSIFWMLEVALLDALMSVPYAGWSMYLDWNVWIGYALVVAVPLFTVIATSRSSGSPAV